MYVCRRGEPRPGAVMWSRWGGGWGAVIILGRPRPWAFTTVLSPLAAHHVGAAPWAVSPAPSPAKNACPSFKLCCCCFPLPLPLPPSLSPHHHNHHATPPLVVHACPVRHWFASLPHPAVHHQRRLIALRLHCHHPSSVPREHVHRHGGPRHRRLYRRVFRAPWELLWWRVHQRHWNPMPSGQVRGHVGAAA
jgi:hypothetical protein